MKNQRKQKHIQTLNQSLTFKERELLISWEGS